MTGGCGGAGSCVHISSAEIYDPATEIFSPTGGMTTTRQSHSATLLDDGRVLVVGGFPPSASVSAELFDPSSGTFTLASLMHEGRQAHQAVLLNNGEVLVTGGFLCCYSVRRSAELYDPSFNSWTLTTGDMSIPRAAHGATLLSDGRVLITGGTSAFPGGSGVPLASAEIYDPVSRTFSPTTGPMVFPRMGARFRFTESREVFDVRQ